MSSIIDYLKKKKEILQKEQKLRDEGDLKQFYKDQLNSLLGTIQVTVIGKDSTISKQDKRQGASHRWLMDSIFQLDQKNQINDDEEYIAQVLADKYDCIIFQLCSQFGGPSIVYYPKNGINQYQLSELQRIHDQMKEFNNSVKENQKVSFMYEINDEEQSDLLDELIKYEIENTNRKAM